MASKAPVKAKAKTEAEDMAKGLTLKQKRLVDEYLKTANKTQAAINAGYSSKRADTALSIARETLGKPQVREYLESRSKEKEDLCGVNFQVLAKKLLEITESSKSDYSKIMAINSLNKMFGYESPVKVAQTDTEGNDRDGQMVFEFLKEHNPELLQKFIEKKLQTE
jgi:phage terminase small subunit